MHVHGSEKKMYQLSLQWSEYQQMLPPFAHPLPLVVINMSLNSRNFCVEPTKRGLDGWKCKFSCWVPDYICNNVICLFWKPSEVHEIPFWWGLGFKQNIFSCPDYCINHVFFTLMKRYIIFWVISKHWCNILLLSSDKLVSPILR